MSLKKYILFSRLLSQNLAPVMSAITIITRGQRTARLTGDAAVICHVDLGGKRDDDRRALSRGHGLNNSQTGLPSRGPEQEPQPTWGGGSAGGVRKIETNEPVPGYGKIRPGFTPA